MSRIGKKPILIPAGVEVKIDQGFIIVKGAKNELKLKTHPHVNVLLNDKEINITVKEPDIKSDKALWGLYGSLIKSMIIGVTSGFQKKSIEN